MCRICREVVDRYNAFFDREIQGCCLPMADEIAERTGGEVVAGYLHFGGARRSHWWVATPDGEVHDPMGEELRDEPGFHREEVHRDRHEFDAILPHHEQWRVDPDRDARRRDQSKGELP